MALTPAERARRYRQRQSDRVALYRIAGDDSLLLALIEARRLTERDAQDRAKVEDALSEIVQEWARRWAK